MWNAKQTSKSCFTGTVGDLFTRAPHQAGTMHAFAAGHLDALRSWRLPTSQRERTALPQRPRTTTCSLNPVDMLVDVLVHVLNHEGILRRHVTHYIHFSSIFIVCTRSLYLSISLSISLYISLSLYLDYLRLLWLLGRQIRSDRAQLDPISQAELAWSGDGIQRDVASSSISGKAIDTECCCTRMLQCCTSKLKWPHDTGIGLSSLSSLSSLRMQWIIWTFWTQLCEYD